MARKKSNKFTGIFKIFFSGLYSYFLYLDQTFKILAFPIFGQIISVSLILTLTYMFNTYYEDIKNSCALFDADQNLYITFFVILFPLFLIFLKAFYGYIINFAGLNLLFYTNSNKKTAKKIDFKANNDIIQRKLFAYIFLMFCVSIIFILPPFIFIAPLIGIFLCLVFQVFSLEGDISPFKAISRSISLVKSNFIPTCILLIFSIALTYIYLPCLFIWACEKTSVYYFLLNNCEKLTNLLPLNDFITNFNTIISSSYLTPPLQDFMNEIMTPLSLARLMAEGTISFIVIGFTLPFRCCCFTELYRLYDSDQIKEFSKDTDEIIKRAGKKGKN